MEEPKMPANIHDTIYDAIQQAMNFNHRYDHAFDPRIDTAKLIEALDWCMAYGAFLYEKDSIQGRDQIMEDKFNDNLEINGDEQDAYKKWMESYAHMLDSICGAPDGPHTVIKEDEKDEPNDQNK